MYDDSITKFNSDSITSTTTQYVNNTTYHMMMLLMMVLMLLLLLLMMMMKNKKKMKCQDINNEDITIIQLDTGEKEIWSPWRKEATNCLLGLPCQVCARLSSQRQRLARDWRCWARYKYRD